VATPFESGSDAAALPFGQYADPVRAEEEARLIGRHWQYACPAESLTRPGTFFATRCAGVPVVVVRDSKECYEPTSTSAGTAAQWSCAVKGTVRRLQCPYHAWTYGLDGSLRAAPRSDREAAFDASSLSLLPAKVSMWARAGRTASPTGSSALR